MIALLKDEFSMIKLNLKNYVIKFTRRDQLVRRLMNSYHTHRQWYEPNFLMLEVSSLAQEQPLLPIMGYGSMVYGIVLDGDGSSMGEEERRQKRSRYIFCLG